MGVVMKKLRSAMEEAGMAVAEFPPCEEFTISIIKLAIILLLEVQLPYHAGDSMKAFSMCTLVS